eukprot:212060-Ditylum_brightwellii.AAC.1
MVDTYIDEDDNHTPSKEETEHDRELGHPPPQNITEPATEKKMEQQWKNENDSNETGIELETEGNNDNDIMPPLTAQTDGEAENNINKFKQMHDEENAEVSYNDREKDIGMTENQDEMTENDKIAGVNNTDNDEIAGVNGTESTGVLDTTTNYINNAANDAKSG